MCFVDTFLIVGSSKWDPSNRSCLIIKDRQFYRSKLFNCIILAGVYNCRFRLGCKRWRASELKWSSWKRLIKNCRSRWRWQHASLNGSRDPLSWNGGMYAYILGFTSGLISMYCVTMLHHVCKRGEEGQPEEVGSDLGWLAATETCISTDQPAGNHLAWWRGECGSRAGEESGQCAWPTGVRTCCHDYLEDL